MFTKEGYVPTPSQTSKMILNHRLTPEITKCFLPSITIDWWAHVTHLTQQEKPSKTVIGNCVHQNSHCVDMIWKKVTHMSTVARFFTFLMLFSVLKAKRLQKVELKKGYGVSKLRVDEVREIVKFL